MQTSSVTPGYTVDSNTTSFTDFKLDESDNTLIYDNYVIRVLIHFKKIDHFAKFTREDLNDYIKFNEVLDEFAKFYHLEKYSKKTIR